MRYIGERTTSSEDERLRIEAVCRHLTTHISLTDRQTDRLSYTEQLLCLRPLATERVLLTSGDTALQQEAQLLLGDRATRKHAKDS